jgi:hypothetical protein
VFWGWGCQSIISRPKDWRCRKGNEELIDEEHKQENSFIDAEIEEVDASVAPGEETKLDVTEEDLANFIGDRAETYFRKFRRFRIDEPDRFSFTWNWAAFFFTYVWLAYRRMYAWALITLLYPIVLASVLLLFSLLPDSLRDFLGHAFSLLLPLLALTLILYFLPKIGQIKVLDIPPKMVYSSSNSQTIQSSA